MSLEDFHTKALRLVAQAGYTGAAEDKVLRDNIISGLASDKIRAKIVKEGHEVTLNQVMEIARLEVSMQQHLERMQETAKVNYVQYGKLTKSKKRSHNLVQEQAAIKGQVTTGDQDPVENLTKDLLYHLTPATDVERGDTKRPRTARLWMPLAEGVERKDIMRKFAYRENALHTLETPQANSAGTGASEPLYFNNEGQPVYTYMVSVPHANKHLIKFPVTLEPTALRRKGTNADSSPSTPSVLLKADTGADFNLMHRQTFNQLFGEAKEVLKPTPIRMENYGNSAVKVLGMFHAFLRWKDRVYRQLFYVTDPPTCCQGMLVTLWEFSNLVTRWRRLLQERLPHQL